MVEYLRHKLSVSVLLYPETEKRMQDVESLKKIWDNVDFFIDVYKRQFGNRKGRAFQSLHKRYVFGSMPSVAPYAVRYHLTAYSKKHRGE